VNRRQAGFSYMLVMAMAMSTFSLFALAVVASDIEAEFGLSKLQLGLIGAVNTGIGGLFAPTAGRLSDRLGGRSSIAAVLVLSGLSSALAALAPSYTVLLLAMTLAGLPQGWANPATNKAISTGIPADQRGVLTGVKQSGVQLATFSSGFAMPAIAAAAGWRVGLWAVAGISVISLIGLRWVTELHDHASDASPRAPTGTGPFPSIVWRVAAFGFVMGTVGGGLGRFLPLFAEEAVGVSATTAGAVFGISGLIAIPSRILWGVALDRGFPTRRALTMLGIGAAVSIAMLLGSPSLGVALLWIGTLLSGLTVGSWNTAANLSMIRESGTAGAGRATGVLLSGFLIGQTIGGPLAGWSIDRFDSYQPAWIASGLVCLLAASIVSGRTDRSTLS
jgi:sugar phosphate permease